MEGGESGEELVGRKERSDRRKHNIEREKERERGNGDW